ncbi:MAG TPA: hypothetical protein VGI67_22380 [Thermoleophilaceae bacterium]
MSVRQGVTRFVRIYCAFFLCISALVLVAFGIGVAPSGGLGSVLEGVAFVLGAALLVFLAVRVVRPLRRRGQ